MVARCESKGTTGRRVQRGQMCRLSFDPRQGRVRRICGSVARGEGKRGRQEGIWLWRASVGAGDICPMVPSSLARAEQQRGWMLQGKGVRKEEKERRNNNNKKISDRKCRPLCVVCSGLLCSGRRSVRLAVWLAVSVWLPGLPAPSNEDISFIRIWLGCTVCDWAPNRVPASRWRRMHPPLSPSLSLSLSPLSHGWGRGTFIGLSARPARPAREPTSLSLTQLAPLTLIAPDVLASAPRQSQDDLPVEQPTFSRPVTLSQ